MKKHILFVLTVFLLYSGFLNGQAVWQDEAVLRHQENITWNQSSTVAVNDSIFILWEKGYQGSLGLFLHKINPQGQAVWEHDILISDNTNIKQNQAITSDRMGNIFIKWEENHPDLGPRIYAVKINEDGEFQWNPHILIVYQNWFDGSLIQDDNNGGLFVVFNKMMGGDTDIYLQHLNAIGELLLPGGGQEIISSNYSDEILFLRPASDHSLIMGYNVDSSKIRIQRFSMNLEPLWIPALELDSTLCSEEFWSIDSPDSSQFAICWTRHNSTSHIAYLQKFDLNGNFLFPQVVQVGPISGNIQNRHAAMAVNSMNEIFTVIHSGDPVANTMRKFDANGNPLWGEGIILSESVSTLFTPIPDGDGGCYLPLLFHDYESGWSSLTYTVQHLDGNGQSLYPGLGIPITNAIPDNVGIIMQVILNDRLTFFWTNRYADKTGLYFQIRNLAGQLLSSSRLVACEGLAGKAYIRGSIAREDDVLVYWVDTRTISFSETGNQLYYQIVNSDGSMDLPENGALLVNRVCISNDYQTVRLANGTVVIIWVPADDATGIMGQAVDAAGNVLWDANGRTLIAFPEGYNCTDLHISAEGDEIYLAWSAYTVNGRRCVIQKIFNGEPQWSLPGIIVDLIPPDNGYAEEPMFFEDGFLVIMGQSGLAETEYMHVTYITPSGTISEVWNDSFINVVEMSYLYWSTLYAKAAIWNGNLLVTFRQGMQDYRYQYNVISPGGEFLIDHVYLINGTLQEYDPVMDIDNDMVFSIMQFDTDNDFSRCGFSKISADNTHPWGDVMIPVYEVINPTSISLGLKGFGNDGYAIYWWENYVTKGGYINSDGDYTSPTGGQVWFQQSYDVPLVNSLGNELYFAWEDFRVMKYWNAGNEIRVQKYANPNLSLTEETVPLVLPSLECFPNPMHSTLTIRLNMDNKTVNKLCIYNLKGQKVKTIYDAMLEKGEHTFTWNGRDAQDKQVAAGVYFVRAENSKQFSTKKIVYVN